MFLQVLAEQEYKTDLFQRPQNISRGIILLDLHLMFSINGKLISHLLILVLPGILLNLVSRRKPVGDGSDVA
jgi:hypothetical protein